MGDEPTDIRAEGGNGRDGIFGEVDDGSRVLAIGGAGSDGINIDSASGHLIARGGAGDDYFTIPMSRIYMDAVGGDGRDTYSIGIYFTPSKGHLDSIVRDFQVGYEGDFLNAQSLVLFRRWDITASRFESNYLHTQSAGTLLDRMELGIGSFDPVILA